jgi:hypothetical protein
MRHARPNEQAAALVVLHIQKLAGRLGVAEEQRRFRLPMNFC